MYRYTFYTRKAQSQDIYKYNVVVFFFLWSVVVVEELTIHNDRCSTHTIQRERVQSSKSSSASQTDIKTLHCTALDRALSNITLCKMVNELYLSFPLSLLLHNAHSLAFLLLLVSFFSYYSFAAAASFAIQRWRLTPQSPSACLYLCLLIGYQLNST